jgi:hypothetical protein
MADSIPSVVDDNGLQDIENFGIFKGLKEGLHLTFRFCDVTCWWQIGQVSLYAKSAWKILLVSVPVTVVCDRFA